MKKIAQLIFIQIVIFSFSLKAQNQTDSLIRFSDLSFHSGFEKEALTNFVKHGKDTFNLFLAIDEKITDEVATNCSQLKLKKNEIQIINTKKSIYLCSQIYEQYEFEISYNR